MKTDYKDNQTTSYIGALRKSSLRADKMNASLQVTLQRLQFLPM